MFKIIADSSCDYKNEKNLFSEVERVPLHIMVGSREYVDDRNLDTNILLDDIDNSIQVAKTQCPSPQSYIDAMEGEADEIFIVNLTNKLSGSYNSALIAANMFMEEHPEKKVHVFDSLGASPSEILVVSQIQELIDKGYNFASIVEKVEYMIKNENKLFFVLENLNTLIKNGRMTKIEATIASLTKIKLLMTAVDGEPALKGKALVMTQALNKIINDIVNSGKDFSDKIMYISHCQAKELAENFKRKVMIKCNFKKIEIFETAGLSSTYANKGGILVAY